MEEGKNYRGKEVHMSRRTLCAMSIAVLVLGMASSAFASDGSAQATGLWIFFGIAIATAFVLGVAAFGTGIGMGNAINGGLQGIARNPEASGKIMTTMILGLALVEALCLYAFVIALFLYFKLPSFEDFVEMVM